MEHDVIPAGERHGPHNWEVADQAARVALTPASANVGHTCWQQSDNTVWVWTASNAWAQLLGSGLPTQIAYGNVIPLDGNKLMPRTQIAAAVSLSIGAKSPGGQCRLSFISDGVNVPLITGASEWNNSFGYDNTGAGLVNVLDVWTDDGAEANFGWSQPAVQVPIDVTSPFISSVAVNGVTMVVTYNEALAATPAAGAYTIRNAGGLATQNPSSVSRSGAIVTLVLGTSATSLNTVTLDVSAGAVSDLAGNPSAAVSGRAVTNNTPPADTSAPTLSSAVVNGASLVLTYNEALNNTAPAPTAYSISGAGGVTQTPSAVSISGSAATLTLATPAVSGNTVSVSYVVPGSNPIRDTAGNPAAALTGQAVTNATGAATLTPLPLTVRNLLTDNGNGTYSGQAGTNLTQRGAPATPTFPTGADGWSGHVHYAANGPTIIAISTDQTSAYDNLRSVVINSSGQVYYRQGAVPTLIEAVGVDGTAYRVARIGTSLVIQKLAPGANIVSGWATIHTFSAVAPTGDIYTIYYTNSTGTIVPVKA